MVGDELTRSLVMGNLNRMSRFMLGYGAVIGGPGCDRMTTTDDAEHPRRSESRLGSSSLS